MKLFKNTKQRLSALALRLVRLLEPAPRCTKCGSKRLERSRNWTGGWNDYCGQAIGRDGTRCYDCGKIVWHQTDEQYQAKLPKWCRAYKSNK
jgi:hypothetical protein